MDQSLLEYVRGAIEALLFVSDKPIQLEEFKEVLETVSGADIKEVISTLQNEYNQKDRGMTIVEIAGGYQMLSSPSYAMAVRRFYKTTHKEKLSKPALETLAIVAYKQPVARIDVELIRGVNSDGVVSHLLDKGLIKVVGRKEVPGRPFIYGTTQQFLEYFGLKSLDDMPNLEEFSLLQSEGESPSRGQEIKDLASSNKPFANKASSEDPTIESDPQAKSQSVSQDKSSGAEPIATDENFSSESSSIAPSDDSKSILEEPATAAALSQDSRFESIIKKEVDVFIKQSNNLSEVEAFDPEAELTEEEKINLSPSRNLKEKQDVAEGEISGSLT